MMIDNLPISSIIDNNRHAACRAVLVLGNTIEAYHSI